MKPLFAIKSRIMFGTETWIVVRYHKINGKWEVMLRNVERGNHRSVPISQLEPYTNHGK